jgi:hypothetical protein
LIVRVVLLKRKLSRFETVVDALAGGWIKAAMGEVLADLISLRDASKGCVSVLAPVCGATTAGVPAFSAFHLSPRRQK